MIYIGNCYQSWALHLEFSILISLYTFIFCYHVPVQKIRFL